MAKIERTVDLAFPPEMVWDALTDPAQLSDWLMPTDFRPEVGHNFTFQADPAPGFDGTVHCTVTHLDPPRHLAFTWKAGKVDTHVTFALEVAADGTRLTLVHDGFGVTQLPVRFILRAGWKRLLTRKLPAHIANQNRS